MAEVRQVKDVYNFVHTLHVHSTGRHWIDLLTQNGQNTRYYKIFTFLHGIIPKQSKAEVRFWERNQEGRENIHGNIYLKYLLFSA